MKPRVSYFFYKISVDGLLTSPRVEFSVFNKELYVFLRQTEEFYYFGKIKEEISNYFTVLIKSNIDS